MIYLISTNRPKWAEFAYKQYLKASIDVNCHLVVLDNSKKGIKFYRGKTADYFHLPQLENVGATFNWFLDNFDAKGEDLFYMDDDVEIFDHTVSEMAQYLGHGWDCVKLSKVGVLDVKSGNRDTWTRRSRGVGSVWLANFDLWSSQRFDEKAKNSVCGYWLRMCDYNCKFIHKILATYMIHDKNVTLAPNCTFDNGVLVK